MRGFSIAAISQRKSAIAEKSRRPNPEARAALKASRAAAPIGMGTCAEFAASMMRLKSLWARSMVKPGEVSPFNTLVGHAILSCPLVAVVP